MQSMLRLPELREGARRALGACEADRQALAGGRAAEQACLVARLRRAAALADMRSEELGQLLADVEGQLQACSGVTWVSACDGKSHMQGELVQ